MESVQNLTKIPTLKCPKIVNLVEYLWKKTALWSVPLLRTTKVTRVRGGVNFSRIDFRLKLSRVSGGQRARNKGIGRPGKPWKSAVLPERSGATRHRPLKADQTPQCNSVQGHRITC